MKKATKSKNLASRMDALGELLETVINQCESASAHEMFVGQHRRSGADETKNDQIDI